MLQTICDETCTSLEITLKTEGKIQVDYYKIPSIKIAGDNKQSDNQLYKCLQSLYESLYAQSFFEKPCKEAFIYRLSGFNRPQNLEIRWIGPKAYLGKIIRCLYEDQERYQKSPYTKIASFMGLTNSNLAGAGKLVKGAKRDR